MPPSSDADQLRHDEIDHVEQLIEIMKKRPGQEAKVKERKAELATLKKKPMVSTIANDQMVLSKVAKDTEEKADRKITAPEASLQKKMDARDGLAKAKTQAGK